MKSYSKRRSLGILICLGILAVLTLAACSRNSAATQPADTVQPTNTVQPSPTKVPPTNTPKPTNPPPTNAPQPSATNAPAPTANPILNITWQWVSVTDQSSGAKTSVPEPNKYTIAFFADGSLTGTADCNTFKGTYSQQNGFSIKLGATTQMSCGEASLDQQYLNLLGNIAAGGPDGAGGLALETAGGAQRMLFKNGGAATKP